jgi:hypothetical protein
MSSISLTLANSARSFEPGEPLEGEVVWQLDHNVPAIEIRLLWYTRGKGDTDETPVNVVKLGQPPRAGRQTFSFPAPRSPYSFSGKLISLCWAIEAVAPPEASSKREDITVAPGRREYVLPG